MNATTDELHLNVLRNDQSGCGYILRRILDDQVIQGMKETGSVLYVMSLLCVCVCVCVCVCICARARVNY